MTSSSTTLFNALSKEFTNIPSHTHVVFEIELVVMPSARNGALFYVDGMFAYELFETRSIYQHGAELEITCGSTNKVAVIRATFGVFHTSSSVRLTIERRAWRGSDWAGYLNAITWGIKSFRMTTQ